MAAAGEHARFVGRVAVEWLDDDPFVARMRLLEPFAFHDAQGRQWNAPAGQILDGRSLPMPFLDRIGQPFVGDYRHTNVIYEAQVKAMSRPWYEVHRMFYQASVAEGVQQVQAKEMFMLLYAAGVRWETRDSSCFRSCHAGLESLSWKPVVEERDLDAMTHWIRHSDPSLDAIERKLDETILKPGPHIFAQGFSRLPVPERTPSAQQEE